MVFSNEAWAFLLLAITITSSLISSLALLPAQQRAPLIRELAKASASGLVELAKASASGLVELAKASASGLVELAKSSASGLADLAIAPFAALRATVAEVWSSLCVALAALWAAASVEKITKFIVMLAVLKLAPEVLPSLTKALEKLLLKL